jgi:hypothetical protein
MRLKKLQEPVRYARGSLALADMGRHTVFLVQQGSCQSILSQQNSRMLQNSAGLCKTFWSPINKLKRELRPIDDPGCSLSDVS